MEPGAAPLRVGAALPDPPFEFMTPAGPAGFDVALMQRIAAQLGREWQLVRYTGADFNGIFAGLDDGSYDCVASGATITPERELVAEFCAPYAVSGQSLVVDPARHPTVRGVADVTGLVIGVQQGNTSQPVADRLVAEHRAARVRVYAYDEIENALDDLSTGGCDAFMKLAPVTSWFVRDRPRLQVVQTGITRERLGVCVRRGNTALREAIDRAQAALVEDGTLGALAREWLGTGADASLGNGTIADALQAIVQSFAADSGTVHLLGADGLLHLAAATPGLPPAVLDAIQRIPVGKGMAGLAVQRARPVDACNIQTDETGDVRPGARATSLAGAIVVPIFRDDAVIGALGIANRAERTFSEAETQALIEAGRTLARRPAS